VLKITIFIAEKMDLKLNKRRVTVIGQLGVRLGKERHAS
jgi:hypothetical protein